MKHLFLTLATIVALGTNLTAQQQQPYPLPLEEAMHILLTNNNAIKISQNTTEIAKAQKQQLNAAWYPTIAATGGYFHFSNDISAQANMGELAQDALANLEGALPGLEQLLQQLLPQLNQSLAALGNITLSVPLVKQNVTTLDATALWPLFTGGKRIFAGKIGKELHTTALHLETLVTNAQMAAMLNAYYTLKLSNDVLTMQTDNMQYITRLLSDARRLKEEGFINKGEFLVVQVAHDEATRELENARHNRKVASSALSAILGIGQEITPCGNWFTLDSLPCIHSIQQEILCNNAQLKILHSQDNILHNRENIAKSNYLPDIALFARGNIYSHNVPKNLLPRSTVGAAMQWTLFDGLAREKEIKKTRLEQEQVDYTISQTESDLTTAATALHSALEDAACNIQTLERTMDLARELLRERERGFAEGFCTSTEVIEARTALTKANTALNLAHWQYCTTLANLLALGSNTEKFIELHNEYRQ